MPNHRLARLAALVLLAALAGCGRGAAVASSPARAPMTPRNGLEVIGAMRRAHPSRALKTLSFTVSITEFRPDSSPIAFARAHAALPGRFRMSLLPSSRRTGFVRDGQRLAVFDRGRRVASLRRVDLTALLAYDLFAQSIDTTIMWLDSARVRFGLARRDELDGRRVWVVGALEGDTTSAQFWVDADRWRVLRVIQRDPRAPDEITDARFTEFRQLLSVPVPTRVDVYRGGRLVERADVSDIRVNPSLPRRAFDLSSWRDIGR